MEEYEVKVTETHIVNVLAESEHDAVERAPDKPRTTDTYVSHEVNWARPAKHPILKD